MSQVVRTALNCPSCGHHFQAIIEQVIDVGADPQAKARFLSGRTNMVTCPNCGHTLAIGTPLLYHDPAKELLLIHVPMELNISTEERERVIGDMTRRLTESIPQEQFKGYLLQPRQALTIPGMIDMILDADGITAEMRDAQREKLRVMEMFLQVSSEQWPTLLDEQAAHVDSEFLEMVIATAQNAAETGKAEMAEGLMALYSYLLQHTDVGQQMSAAIEAQDATVREVADELGALGENMSRDDFMALVLRYAGDEQRVQALVGLMRPALDYQFFEDLSSRIEAADGDDRQRLETLRDRLLDLTSIIDQQTQAVIQRATDTLRVIVNSQDIDAAIRPRLEMIDDTFLAVLQANIQAAEQGGETATADRLKEVLQRVLTILRESAPPQIRFINDLMSTADDAEVRELVETQSAQFGPELLELMEAIARDLDENGQAASAERLRGLRELAAEHVSDTPQIAGFQPDSSPLSRN